MLRRGKKTTRHRMYLDLPTEDLKRKRARNESLWLIGEVDVKVKIS